MGFTGAHMLYYVLDVFILALYLLSHVCALLEYTFKKFQEEVGQCVLIPKLKAKPRDWDTSLTVNKLVPCLTSTLRSRTSCISKSLPA